MSKQKVKGTAFEQAIVDYLNESLDTDTFHRLSLRGTQDEGDVWGLFAHGKRIVLEAKNHRRMALAEWLDEAENERGNADALAAVVVHKRKGCGEKSFGRTYCTLSLDDLLALITGVRADV